MQINQYMREDASRYLRVKLTFELMEVSEASEAWGFVYCCVGSGVHYSRDCLQHLPRCRIRSWWVACRHLAFLVRGGVNIAEVAPTEVWFGSAMDEHAQQQRASSASTSSTTAVVTPLKYSVLFRSLVVTNANWLAAGDHAGRLVCCNLVVYKVDCTQKRARVSDQTSAVLPQQLPIKIIVSRKKLFFFLLKYFLNKTTCRYLWVYSYSISLRNPLGLDLNALHPNCCNPLTPS